MRGCVDQRGAQARGGVGGLAGVELRETRQRVLELLGQRAGEGAALAGVGVAGLAVDGKADLEGVLVGEEQAQVGVGARGVLDAQLEQERGIEHDALAAEEGARGVEGEVLPGGAVRLEGGVLAHGCFLDVHGRVLSGCAGFIG